MNKILRISILGGLLGGLLCIGYFSLLALLNFNPLGQYKYIYIGFYAVAFISSLKYFRDYHNKGWLSVWEGLGIGFCLNISACIILLSLGYCLLEFVDYNQIVLARHQFESLNLLNRQYILGHCNENEYLQVRASLSNMTHSDILIDTLVGVFMTGGFHTFFFMLIFKNKNVYQK